MVFMAVYIATKSRIILIKDFREKQELLFSI